MSMCLGANQTDLDQSYWEKIRFEKSWAWWLNIFGTFAVFGIGFCGNILCLFVLCRRRLRKNSYTQYLIALAFVDTGAIFSELISAIEEFHRYKRGQASPLIEHTEYTCKLFDYFRYILYSMSSWVIVALAVERLVAIKFPLWSKYICTVVNARRIIVLILLFTMLIQSYRLVIKGLDCSQISNTNGTCRCKTLPDYAHIDLALTIYVWRLILMTLFPLTVIITVNILIMSKLFNEGSLLDHTNTSGNARQKMRLVYKISRMLVIVTSVYLLLHVPGSILEIFKFLYLSVFRNCNLKLQYYIHVTQDVFDLLTNFNYGINFYLYIVSGKHIRNELVRVFRESSWRSKSSVKNSRYRRSSYFMSSYVQVSKSPQARSSHVPLSRRPTGSSL